MTEDTFLVIAFGVMVVLIGVMVAVGIPRGKRMQDTDERIVANQRKQMALAERQTAAV